MFPDEKPPQSFLRDVRLDGKGKQRIARRGDGIRIQIRRKDLDGRRRFHAPRLLQQKDGQRLRVLSGSATGAPDADRVSCRLASENGRD